MPLLWLSIAFLAGIVLAPQVRLSTGAWLVLAAISILIPILLRLLRGRFVFLRPAALRISSCFQRLSPLMAYVSRLTSNLPPIPFAMYGAASLLAPLLPFFLALGAARYQSAQPVFDPGTLGYYNNARGEVEVLGVLVDLPDRRDSYTLLKLRSEELRLDGSDQALPVEGLFMAYVYSPGEWKFGDRLRLRGELSTPAADELFSYQAYLARQGVYSFMGYARAEWVASGQGNWFWSRVYAFKARALETVYRLWPDPEAGLLAGILLGVESGIPEDVKGAFQETGTSHIIAISGFNITVIAGLLGGLFGRLVGRYRGALLAAIGILLYTLLVGAGPSVVRAALMGGLSIFAVQLGRRQTGLNTLAFVAALMALFNPLIIGDAGFQLSFASTLGLVLYATPFSQAFQGLAARRLPAEAVQRLSRPVSEYLLYTLAAQLTSLPVMILHFRQVSLSSLLVNPLVLPVQPAVMVLGGIGVLLGMAFLSLGQVAGAVAWPFAAYTIRLVEAGARLPGGAYPLGFIGGLGIALFYAALLGLTFAGKRAWQVVPAVRPGIGLAALGVLTALVWRAALSAPDGRLHLTVLPASTDTVSGAALLIQTPGGRSVLINGGASARQLSAALGRRLPAFNRRLDFLIVSRPDNGEVDALPEVIGRFSPGQAIWAGKPKASSAAVRLGQVLEEMGVRIEPAETGQRLDLGDGASLEVLAASPLGGVYLLSWGNFRALLPVGIGFEDLEALGYGRRIGPVNVLLLGDHGYAPVNPPEWIANLRPELVLLSVAPNDKQGLPSPETLEAVAGYSLLRTDKNGWIEISTDGERMWVEVERR